MRRSPQILAAAVAALIVPLAIAPSASAGEVRRFSCADYRGLDMGLVTVTVVSPSQISAIGRGGRQTLNRIGKGQTYAGAGYTIVFSRSQQKMTMSFPRGGATCFWAP